MDASTRPSSYDLFKLIVAIILLILFLLLLRRPTAAPLPLTAAPPTGSPPSAASATPDANPIAVLPTSTSGPLPSPTGSIESTLTAPLPSPSATNIDAPTGTPLPSQTATNTEAPTASQTPLPTPTATLVSESTPPIDETPPAVTACEAAASRSRLQTGGPATIRRRLNFRSSPGIRDNWLRTNMPGTVVEVVGGPECVPHLAGAYFWWQIELPTGEIGWSAEGSIHGTFYFMEVAE